jgi:hypothetical protein
MQGWFLTSTKVATTLFAVGGVTFWTFLASLVLSLPRQIIGVYLGGKHPPILTRYQVTHFPL